MKESHNFQLGERAGAMMAQDAKTIVLATELTVAWLTNPNTRVSAADVPGFLMSTHRTIADLMAPSEPPAEEPEPTYEPAVSVRKSLSSRDRIISLIDGKPYMSLARHLKMHNLTPDQYRQRYGLKPDYPMVAPAYSEARRAMAMKIGLGGRAAAARAAAAAAAPQDPETTPRPRKAARKPKAELVGADNG